jgi:hypothetical protein
MKYLLTDIALKMCCSPESAFGRYIYNNNNNNNNAHNNNNNTTKLQLGCHPVAVVILHVYKYEIGLLLNLRQEGYMRSM